MSNRAAWSVLFAVAAVSACGGASDNDFFGEPAAGADGTTGGASGSGTSGGAGGTKATGGASGKGGSATGGADASGGTGGSSTGGSATGGSATGGTDASGGTGASGGSDASGGSGGTSGDGGTAGDGSGATGGNATGGSGGASGGTGGSAGSAGMATGGAGGVSGSAGAGGTTAGKGGSAGSGGQKGCDTNLPKQYDQALEQALVCNPNSGKEQCTKLVASHLECGCGVYVNPDNEEAVAELERINKQVDELCPVPCPAVLCAPPAPGGCFPDGKDGGRCMESLNAMPF